MTTSTSEAPSRLVTGVQWADGDGRTDIEVTAISMDQVVLNVGGFTAEVVLDQLQAKGLAHTLLLAVWGEERTAAIARYADSLPVCDVCGSSHHTDDHSRDDGKQAFPSRGH